MNKQHRNTYRSRPEEEDDDEDDELPLPTPGGWEVERASDDRNCDAVQGQFSEESRLRNNRQISHDVSFR